VILLDNMKNKGSNKSFGFLFFFVFLIISFWPTFNGNVIDIKFLFLSLIFLILGLMNSKILTPLNNCWIKIGELLGNFVAPIVMGIVFFVIITPIGLVLRILDKDLLRLKFNKSKSYWIDREENIGTMKKQF